MGVALLAALASFSCQETFHFVTIDAGSNDGGLDAGDAGLDAGPDAGPDAGVDAGVDAGDAGVDAGFADGTPCATDDQCLSDHCLGRCCSTVCSTQDPNCGATGCDDSGVCLYPDAGTTCGTIAPVCSADKLDFHSCDGIGACKESIAVCPGGFLCRADGNSCANACDAGACPDASFCDGAQTECCPVFAGNAIHIDQDVGSDLGCCGTPAQPCQTLTRAMELVVEFGVTGFDLIVAGGPENADAGGIDWTANEKWPIQLHLGVTLIAPNVHFTPPAGTQTTAFEVLGDSTDAMQVEILGYLAAPVIIGIDTKGINLNSTTIAVDDGAAGDGGYNLPLALQYVWMNGADAGLRVGAGANVDVGMVAIGSSWANSYPSRTTHVQGTIGILCQGTAMAPAMISGSGSLNIDSQSSRDLDAEDYCQVVLNTVGLGTGTPYPYPGGIASCTAKPDSTGLFATGVSQLAFYELWATCMDGYGAYLLGTDAGAPVVTATTGDFENCGCAGVYLAGGAQLISDVNIHFCQVGLKLADDWRAVPGKFTPLSQFGASTSCNSAAEPSDLCRTRAGMDFFNATSATTADARGLEWDLWSDAGTTQLWDCSDDTLTSCTCQGAFCSTTSAVPLPDDADAVYLQSNTSAKPFNLKGGAGISYYGCN
jgi:hypothetical protein